MEAKLKTQRVADLRELLQKASVSIPAKANKADLIAKILASPAAIEVFNNPGSTATVAAAASKPKAPETSQAGQDDDLLAPPEEFDWGPATANGAQGSPEAPATSVPKAVSKPAASKPAVTTKESGIEQSTAKPATSTGAGATGVSQDEELEKRKRRAARFNIPFVETKPKATPASSGPKTPRSAPPAKNLSPEEVAKIEARAARFGMPKIANSATNATTVTTTPAATTTTTATIGKKRARSPAPVDKEEMEKRQRRAERFASGGETKAQT